MKRRAFVKTLPLAALAPAVLPTPDGSVAFAESASDTATGQPSSGASPGGGKTPDWAEHVLDSDMQGLGPDGKLVWGSFVVAWGDSGRLGGLTEVDIAHIPGRRPFENVDRIDYPLPT